MSSSLFVCKPFQTRKSFFFLLLLALALFVLPSNVNAETLNITYSNTYNLNPTYPIEDITYCGGYIFGMGSPSADRIIKYDTEFNYITNIAFTTGTPSNIACINETIYLLKDDDVTLFNTTLSNLGTYSNIPLYQTGYTFYLFSPNLLRNTFIVGRGSDQPHYELYSENFTRTNEYDYTHSLGSYYFSIDTNDNLYQMISKISTTNPSFYLLHNENNTISEYSGIIPNITTPATKNGGFVLNNKLYVLNSTTSINEYDFILPSFINYPPNPATNIQPSNTTITLNSTGVTFPINWSGGDDNNSDTVTTQTFIKLLGSSLFIGNTTSQTISATLNNSLTSSSLYYVYLNLTDGVNYTISEGDYFTLCVNDWIGYNTSCVDNLQTLLYNDSNSCPLQYDIPLDNGIISACDIGSGEGTSVEVELEIDYVFIILFLITLFLIITAFMTKSLTIFFLSIVFVSLLTMSFYNTYEETLIIVGGGLTVLSLLIALMKNYV